MIYIDLPIKKRHLQANLQRLPKAHVIGQNAAQTIPGVVHQPVITLAIKGTIMGWFIDVYSIH
jgi:hypothetical protein